jgi:hypothetical protein
MLQNLNKLFHESPKDPATIAAKLEDYFYKVVSERRNEPFFTMHFKCKDEAGRVRLIVRYGWSERFNKWFYEPLRGSKC